MSPPLHCHATHSPDITPFYSFFLDHQFSSGWVSQIKLLVCSKPRKPQLVSLRIFSGGLKPSEPCLGRSNRQLTANRVLRPSPGNHQPLEAHRDQEVIETIYIDQSITSSEVIIRSIKIHRGLNQQLITSFRESPDGAILVTWTEIYFSGCGSARLFQL